ncbi:MAG: Tn3 family transposase [Gemmataceae bacterium]|nr:Tn3 family transposase [Gemmataceae bacterium]
MEGEKDNPGKRVVILGHEEIAALYGRPCFTPQEREEYFTLSLHEKAALGQLHSHKSKLFFILQLGYFKARQMFFPFDLRDVAEDAAYVRQKYFLRFEDADPGIAEGTRLKQQRLILGLCKYRAADAATRSALAMRARQAAATCGKSAHVFRELMRYLAEQRIVAPGYSVLQNIVGGALAFEQRRLSAIVNDQADASAIAALNRLLENPQGLHEITRLKRDPRDFSHHEIRREVERGEQMRELYDLSCHLLPQPGISNENIRHYASLVEYYSVYKLRQLQASTVYVYLLCFIHHRYRKLHDNLIQSLLYHVRRHDENARDAARELAHEFRLAANADLPKGARILQLFTDGGIPGNVPFEQVRQKAFALLPAARLDAVAEYLAAKARFDEKSLEWRQLDKAAQRIKLNLRPVLQGVAFAATADDPLIEAARFLEEASRSGKPLSAYREQDIPMGWVPDKMRRHLYEKDGGRRKLLVDRYEFLLYRQLRNGVEAGDVFCRDSVRFRSLKDDLIDEQLWREHKDRLLAEAGLAVLQQPIETHLAELKDRLETRLAEVNRRIAAGENSYFKFKPKGNGRWTLEYPTEDEETNHPFFDRLPQTDINGILRFAARQCGFMGAFTHRLGRFGKHVPDASALVACLAGWGTNTGLPRMGQISDVGYHALAATSDNYLRPETLREANDIVSNAIAALPIFHHYDIGGLVHSSSDGQKFETAVRAFTARHSPKYFGLKKGIVSYTLVANHVPVNARNISADDHESHFLFDVLYNNGTDIQPDLHSADTHNTNPVNHALLYVFGPSFAPRYRDIYDKVRTSLLGFHHPSHYGDAVIKPVRKVKEQDIVREWDECQRIFVSLIRKDATQSTLVRKLSSHRRTGRVKAALWEYDGIHRSLYLLDYIDSPALRRHVQKAMNRGENYHQLRRAISHAGFGRLRFKTEYEQELWSECSRLIANCILYYNASVLSRLLEHQEKSGDVEGAEATKQVSPIAWQHVNLQGRYEFLSQPEPLNLDAVIRELTSPPIGRVLHLVT